MANQCYQSTEEEENKTMKEFAAAFTNGYEVSNTKGMYRFDYVSPTKYDIIDPSGERRFSLLHTDMSIRIFTRTGNMIYMMSCSDICNMPDVEKCKFAANFIANLNEK